MIAGYRKYCLRDKKELDPTFIKKRRFFCLNLPNKRAISFYNWKVLPPFLSIFLRTWRAYGGRKMKNFFKRRTKMILACICMVTIISGSIFSSAFLVEAQGASFWDFFANLFKKPTLLYKCRVQYYLSSDNIFGNRLS